MRYLLTYVVAMLMVFGVSGAVSAAKTRSCDAQLRVDLNPRGQFPVKGNYVIESYSASGRGATANAARRAARTNARQCAGVTWQERWQTVPPNNPYIYPQCRPDNRVNHFDLSNIKCAIHDAVCSLKLVQGRPEGFREEATVYLVTSGQSSSCASLHRYSASYGVTICSQTERTKVCGNLPYQNPEN